MNPDPKTYAQFYFLKARIMTPIFMLETLLVFSKYMFLKYKFSLFGIH